jgi:mRNA interferase MazF
MIRGEIWWINYDSPNGSEPGYKRPGVIIQNDFFNASRINTTIVIPLTTNELLADIPGNFLISKKESKLPKDSTFLIPQIGVIDKMRLDTKVCKLNNDIIKKIEENILFVLVIKLI